MARPRKRHVAHIYGDQSWSRTSFGPWGFPPGNTRQQPYNCCRICHTLMPLDESQLKNVHFFAENVDQFKFSGGRRICSGIHLVKNPLFILGGRSTVADLMVYFKLLWSFDVRPFASREEEGHLTPGGGSVILNRFETVFKRRGGKRKL